MSRLLAPVAAAAILTLAPVLSQASLIIQITDGTNTLNVADGSAADQDATVGGVAYAGSFGAWTFFTAVGSSDSDPLSMQLTAGVNGRSNSGTLWIKFTHIDLSASADPLLFMTQGGGAGPAGSQAEWTGWVDDSNAAFGMDQQIFGAVGYATAAGSTSAALNGSYSATLVTSFDYSGVPFQPFVQGASLDVNQNQQIPEPSSLALLGIGLVGAGVARRRKA